MRCSAAARLVAGGEEHPRARSLLAGHRATCLRCQAEAARHQRLRRLLAQLRAEQVSLRPGVLAQVVEAIGEAAEQAASPGTAGARPAWRRLSVGASFLGALLAATIGLLTTRRHLTRPSGAPARCYRGLPLVAGARRAPG